MTAVTFGDLLFTGVGHLAAAAGRWDQEAGDPLAAGRQLYRVVDVMTRYVDGVAPWDYAGALAAPIWSCGSAREPTSPSR